MNTQKQYRIWWDYENGEIANGEWIDDDGLGSWHQDCQKLLDNSTVCNIGIEWREV